MYFFMPEKTRENPPLNLHRQHVFQNKFTLRARKMQISSDRLVVKPAGLTFTLFWRENFPSCLDHCFEYLEREILEKNSKHGLKNTSPRKTALMVTHSVPLSVGCLSTRV